MEKCKWFTLKLAVFVLSFFVLEGIFAAGKLFIDVLPGDSTPLEHLVISIFLLLLLGPFWEAKKEAMMLIVFSFGMLEGSGVHEHIGLFSHHVIVAFGALIVTLKCKPFNKKGEAPPGVS